jgi:hypothetical protein
MRVAIFVRGPFRPDIESGLARAKALKDEVRANGGEPSLFFATWTTEDRAPLETLLAQSEVDHALVIGAPPERMVYEICGRERTPGGNPVRNFFYQYYLSKIGLRVVESMGRFDFIMHTRPDLDIRLGAYYPHWFEAGRYVTLHDKTEQPGTFTNDQFSVATTKDMLAAWDYGTLDDLGELIRNSEVGEDPLDQIIVKSGVRVRTAPTERVLLDPRRFDPPHSRSA